MRKVAFILLLLLAVQPVKAQSLEYMEVLNTFKVHFNNRDAKAAFGMMSDNLQKQIGIDNMRAIIHTFRDNLGPIQSFTFYEMEGAAEVYETQFEQGKQNISMLLNEKSKMIMLRFLPAEEEEVIAKMDRNKTKLALPFKGEWFTVWGGDTKAQNYHVISKTQKHAFDFLVLDEKDRSYTRSGTRNEDYYAFGKPIYAVCDAEVFKVITGVEDNRPGIMNPTETLGNSVILKTPNEEYIVYAHFEKETIKVKEGDTVLQGQYLGNCGNSGNSTEPHLHLHIQDGPNLLTSVGVKCYFENVLKNGKPESDYSPVKFDRITRPPED